MSFFRAVRLFSYAEVTLFAALLVVWIGHIDEEAEFVLGLSHGIGWIGLCLVVWLGCLRKIFPWPLFAATVSPLGPVGSTIGIEVIRRRAGVG